MSPWGHIADNIDCPKILNPSSSFFLSCEYTVWTPEAKPLFCHCPSTINNCCLPTRHRLFLCKQSRTYTLTGALNSRTQVTGYSFENRCWCLPHTTASSRHWSGIELWRAVGGYAPSIRSSWPFIGNILFYIITRVVTSSLPFSW